MNRPVERQVHITARAEALRLLLTIAAGNDAAVAKRSAVRGLASIEQLVAIAQASPRCPEAWLEGMFDIEQALREAIALMPPIEPR